MRIARRAVCLLATIGLLAAAPAAGAADLVGIGDQSAAMFSSPLFQQLDVPISRIVVSYDAVLKGTQEVAAVDAWMAAATQSGVRPLIAFEHARGCYDGKGVVRRPRCRLPSAQRFAQAFDAFRTRYPLVADYSPWNEANHRGQPTARRPDRAAVFYNIVRERCPGCTVVAVDVLDIPGMSRYVRAFARRADGSPRLWGLHNYRDTNTYRSRTTRELLRTVRGEVWLTETGGLVRSRQRAFSPSHAARATRYMFRLARASPRITRLYIYNWTGAGRHARFDAGLTTPNGLPRPAYFVVRQHIGRTSPAQPSVPPAPGPPEPPPPICPLLPIFCP